MNSSQHLDFCVARRPTRFSSVWTLGLLAVGCLVPATAMAQNDVLSMYLFNGLDEAAFRRKTEDHAALQLAQLNKLVQFEDKQRTKLEWAIQGDLRRFYRCLAMAREKTKHLDVQNNQEDMQKAWEVVMPLQQRLSGGLLDNDSLYQKVLDATLTGNQNETYQNYLRARSQARAHAMIAITISDLEQTVPLLQHQRDQLVKLLLAEPLPQTVPRGYEPYLGYILLTRVEVDALEQMLDAAQFQAVKKFNQQYAAYARSVRW